MIKNPDEPYVGPRGMTKREYIMLEFSKVFIQQHGIRAGLWHAKQTTERLINFADELKNKEKKKPSEENEDDD